MFEAVADAMEIVQKYKGAERTARLAGRFQWEGLAAESGNDIPKEAIKLGPGP